MYRFNIELFAGMFSYYVIALVSKQYIHVWCTCVCAESELDSEEFYDVPTDEDEDDTLRESLRNGHAADLLDEVPTPPYIHYSLTLLFSFSGGQGPLSLLAYFKQEVGGF